MMLGVVHGVIDPDGDERQVDHQQEKFVYPSETHAKEGNVRNFVHACLQFHILVPKTH